MFTFGTSSKKHLATCDQEIQRVLKEAIKHYDFSVVCGFRNEEDQNRAFDDGYSTLKWPDSNHNVNPCKAVDVIPYPSGYDDVPEFYVMATYIMAAANKLGIDLKWGGHWKSFKDYPHFEL